MVQLSLNIVLNRHEKKVIHLCNSIVERTAHMKQKVLHRLHIIFFEYR
jgi:hypothetical protein